MVESDSGAADFTAIWRFRMSRRRSWTVDISTFGTEDVDSTNVRLVEGECPREVESRVGVDRDRVLAPPNLVQSAPTGRTRRVSMRLHSKLIVVLLIGISLSQKGWELPAAISWGEIYGVCLRCVTGCRRRESLSGLYDKEEMEG